MKELNISIPEGYEIDVFDKDKGKVTFKKIEPKNIMDQIKDIDDVLFYHGTNMNKINEIFQMLPSSHIKYQYIAELLCRALNEGWEPDWNDNNQYKHFPWFHMAGSSGFRFCGYDTWATDSRVGSRLCFKSRELAEYAGKQFADLYNKFML